MMYHSEKNPSAFPRRMTIDQGGHIEDFGAEGMTLWEWYAGQALLGLMASGERANGLAERAFDQATAMMNVRAERLGR